MTRFVALAALALAAGCSSNPSWDDVSGKPETFPADEARFQRRIAEPCPPGQAIAAVSSAGEPSCVPVATAPPALSAELPLSLEATASGQSVSLGRCADGQVLEMVAGFWSCVVAGPRFTPGTGLQVLAGDVLAVSFNGPSPLAGTFGVAARVDHAHGESTPVPIGEFALEGGGTSGVSTTFRVRSLLLPPGATAWALARVPDHHGGDFTSLTVRVLAGGAGTLVVGTGTLGTGSRELTVGAGDPIPVFGSALGSYAHFAGVIRTALDTWVVIRLENAATDGPGLEVLGVDLDFLAS